MLNTKAYLNAVYSPPLRKPGALPRLFVLHWDNHKVHSKRRDKDDWHECYDTRYPDGGVTLQYGMFYRSMGEMEAAYEAMGSYRIEWCDEQEKEAQ